MVKRITEEEKNIISNCINDLIYNGMKKPENIAAVYVTAYKTTAGVWIYVNFVDFTYSQDDYRAVHCRVKGIKIDKVIKASSGFGYMLEENNCARTRARELLCCEIIYAYEGWYKRITESAKKLGLTQYKQAITFEPPLDLSESKKLR